MIQFQSKCVFNLYFENKFELKPPQCIGQLNRNIAKIFLYSNMQYEVSKLYLLLIRLTKNALKNLTIKKMASFEV